MRDGGVMMNQPCSAFGRFLVAIAAVALALPSAAATIDLMEGVDYAEITPQPVADPARIEVIEFFHYGCESCSRLEPHLQVWQKALPADILFRRVPALRRVAWAPLTKIYFALEQLGELERLHAQVYAAVHEGRLNPDHTAGLRAWARASGLDSEQFERLLISDQVNAQVQGARDATVAYGIRATPSFVVDGRYMTSGGMVGSLDALLPTVDSLIDKVRALRLLK